MTVALLQLEVRRASRNRRTFLFSAGIPIFFYLAFSSTPGRVGGLNPEKLGESPQ